MSTTDLGRAAEARAASYLENCDFDIVDRNWRNRWCELDIVAHKGDIVHFVEVKYRKSSAFGSGFDYITPDKRDRLQRAAAAWAQAHHYAGDYQIDVVSVTDTQIEILENII